MKQMPESSGRPLTETPNIPMIGYLEGDFGKRFLEAYNAVVDKEYEGNKRLKVLDFDGNVVTGSSTYPSIIASDILRQSGLELARPVDLEHARKLHDSNPKIGLDTSGQYVDYGVVFRSVDNPNEYLAEILAPQIKKALGVKNIETPVVVLSGNLELLNDESASDGLGLALRKGAKPFAAPALKRGARFNKTDENGLPVPDENGARISYTIETGLSRLYLGRGLDLYSPWGDLAYSDPAGRVVAIKK